MGRWSKPAKPPPPPRPSGGSLNKGRHQTPIHLQVPDFNQRLNESDFIFYYCSLDPLKNQVILDHWGASELHTTSKELVMACPFGFPKDLKYISFKVSFPAGLYPHRGTRNNSPRHREGMTMRPPCWLLHAVGD